MPNCENREAQARNETLQLVYREFASYYVEQRCCWAPENPRRLFNLACKTMFRRFGKRITLWELVGEMYAILGLARGEPRGLFQDFDPSLYDGKLPLDSHFTNMFKQRLRARLWRACYPRSGRDRLAKAYRFQANPRLSDCPIRQITQPVDNETRRRYLWAPAD
jgi:hypothetical protein